MTDTVRELAESSSGAGVPHAPAPEQAAAIGDRDRDLFLAAGAGTGKTTVLVERFCDAVCAGEGPDAEVGVENVLAFTFTERAAGELKRRIRAELARRAEGEADERRARWLRSLARDSESAWISTIHSFCRRLLAAHPLAAGLDPGFGVLGETEAARVAAEAFDAAFERFGAAGDPERFEIAAAYRLPALRTLVRAAHDELRARGAERPLLPPLAPPTLDPAVSALHDAATAALAAASGAKRTKPVERCLALIADARAGTAGSVPSEEEVAGWLVSSKVLDGPELDRYREARELLERRLVEVRFADHYEHLRALFALYAEEYARLKDDRSALDFEDLLLRARRLLSDRPEIRGRYQRQFRHLMVDEFQDTNPLQVAVIGLLHGEPGAAANRLFTVGDELQSIYAFRHADVEVFRSQRAVAESAPDERARVRRLAGNFRSAPELLALVNTVGEALFGRGFERLAVGRLDKPPYADPSVEVLVTERDGWDEEDGEVSPDERAQPWRVAEARFLAGRLAALHEAGVPRGEMVVLLRSFTYVEAYEGALAAAGLAPYVVGGRGYWSKQQVTDVRNLLGCVANPLDEKALFGALASPACGVAPDTLWLLRRAAGTAPAWSALRWLYGPAPAEDGDAADALEAWRERAEESAAHVPERDAEALREFVETLLELRGGAPRLSLEALIDRVITATGYDLALLMRPAGRRRMANVRKLMRLAREFEADQGRDLRAFLDFVASEAGQDGREAEAAVDAEGHDGVRVMTVHAAKGLQFPVVAVADLGRRLAAGAGPALRLEPVEGGGDGEGGEGAMRVGLRLARLGRKQKPIFDYAELQDRAVEREREEERRILHVAMTRAERQLVLSGALELEKLWDEPKGTEPLIAPVLRALGWREGLEAVELAPPPVRPGLAGEVGPVGVAIRTQTPAGPVRLPDFDRSQPDSERPLRDPDRQQPDSDRPLSDPDLAPPAVRPSAPVRAVSYSALSLHQRCGYRFYAERVLGLRPRLPGRPQPAIDEWHPPDDPGTLASRYAQGRVVHELLEQSARSGWAPPDPGRAAELLRSEGGGEGPEQARRVVRLVEGFLEAPIRSELADAARLHPEVPFAFRAGGLVVRGEVDLLADLGAESLLIDYKSDALDGTEPAAQMERYEVQRRIYALAALRRYGKPVRVAYVFLERPGEPVEQRFGSDDAGPLTEEVERMAAAIAAGRFPVTDRPERSLCLDCPAREHLCIHGPELTLRDLPAD
jgi:ATP-dependent helicase/nuclease subunit A